MAHEKRFQGIPMSKSMRGLCKEEDYAFLGERRRTEDPSTPESDWSKRHEERIRRRQEREQQEQERQRELEENKKEKEQQWRSHVAELASQEHGLQDRLARLRRFREFQRKVLQEESGLEPKSTCDTKDELLTRT